MIVHEESGVVGDVTGEDRIEYDEQKSENYNGNENSQNVNERMSMGEFLADRDQHNLNEKEKVTLQQLNEINGRERMILPTLRGME